MEKVSDFLVKRLAAWGVRRIFGYPGDGINGILNAMNSENNSIDFIQVRHEEMASLMACGHAKFTGEVGVCLATSGPGAIHLLNGLYDAKLDHQPVLAIVGQKARTAMGGHAQQEVDLMALFKDVAGDYVHMATEASQIRHLIDRAFRIAKSERTVTCVIIPNDVQELEYTEPERNHQTIHSGIGFSTPRIIPKEEDLKKAAEVLNAGRKVAILIGAGALQAGEEVQAIANVLGAGVAKAYLGKAALPDDLSFVTGPIGFFGTDATHKMMEACDTLLMIGSGFPYAEFLPPEGQGRAVQIDIDGKMLSIRYPMEVNLVGDSAETINALLPLLEQKKDSAWRDTIEQDIRNWHSYLDELARQKANPLNPRLVFQHLSPLLPQDCIFTADSGSTSSWTAQHIQVREGMKFSVSGTLATMGCAIPYAIAAKFAFPDRMAVAFVGDGAMQMNGNDALITIQKYWKQWANPQLIILVVNNRDLNFVTWEQRLMQGEPKFDDSQVLPDFNYADYASSLGLIGIRVESPEQVESALEEAIHAGRPVLIDAVTDPEIIPFTPSVAEKFAKNIASAIQKGDQKANSRLEGHLKKKVKEAQEK